MKKTGLIILAIIVVIIIVIGTTYFDLIYYKFFAPKFEDARREVFEQTRAYNQAKLQELAKYKYEYETASAENKPILASAIRHKFADYNTNKFENIVV